MRDTAPDVWPDSTKDYLVVPTKVAQAIVTYLEGRPHREVRQMIDAIINCNPKPKPDE